MTDPKSEIRALYALLDDPQPVVQTAVYDRLYEMGEAAVPLLHAVMHDSENPDSSNADRVEEFVKNLRTRMAMVRLSEAFDNPEPLIDLEEGMKIIAKYGYPDVDTSLITMKLDDMAHDIAVLAGTRSTPFERFMRMRSYMFSELGYLGNREDYYNPDNSYVNKVLESRKGIPISLSALMMLLGRRLDIPLQGIGMPMHFLLQYDDGTRNFFVDPFTSGMIITTEQCQAMLASSGIKFTQDMLAPVTNRDMLERMWRNLYLAYQQNNDQEESAMVAELLKLVSPEFEINDNGGEDDDEDEEEEF